MKSLDEKKLYTWAFVGLFSIAMVFTLNKLSPTAPSLFTMLGGNTLGAAVADAIAPADVNRDSLASLITHGVKVTDVVYGTGALAQEGTLVAIDYFLKTKDGITLLDTEARGDLYTFTIGDGSVIKGFDVGVRGMRVGGVRTLVIPPEYAYGDLELPGVEQGDPIVFTIKLRGIR